MSDQPQASTQKDPKRYKTTLNLPKTSFPMKANLVQNEAISLKRWDKVADGKGVYSALRELRQDAPPYVFHDGPPYANGSIHLGHLLNKVLKDLVVRSRSMDGYNCPYTPGWDCHGLPIEHKVMQDLGDKAREMEPIQIRRKCKTYAEKQVKGQKAQMERLMTLADYNDPYLTMLPRFEGGVIDVFAGLVEKGLVNRQLKPVHWSLENQTALAEAELEYYDREDTSIYTWFALKDSAAVSAAFGAEIGAETVSLMIWTTTPWTLPANVAAAVHPRNVYALVNFEGKLTVIAEALIEKVAKQRDMQAPEIIATCKGDALAGLAYAHPFLAQSGGANLAPSPEQIFTIQCAEYVTLEDGTGIVHIAPGHGAEDYQVGLSVGLPVYCPVQGNGTYDDTTPDWLKGQHIFKANEQIVERLKENGNLYHSNKFMHSYPHDWRGKKPVIFRATSQWFIQVDKEMGAGAPTLRVAAQDQVENHIDFVPTWGQNRLRGMLETRPDWCVSRQRSWGLPIPAFFNAEGEALMTLASVKAVAEIFRQHGSDSWYTQSADVLLGDYDVQADADAPEWAKQPGALENLTTGKDTFDVWFESGSSWSAVLRSGWKDKQVTKDGVIADLYLEGSDQHRGWFQHSLLPAVALEGVSPFKTVLTHGFMVDKNGQKMSKSGGNAVSVDDLFKQYGVDIARWWVCTLNFANDIKVDMEYFKLAGDEYRKVRNTLKFLLSNLSDAAEGKPYEWSAEDGNSIDAWVMREYVQLVEKVKVAYSELRFRDVSRQIFNFCNGTLSSVYMFATKDRLYCDAIDSPRRRRSQDAMRRITDGLCRLLAPIVPHTADEAYRYLKGVDVKDTEICVHLQTFPSCTGCSKIAASLNPAWDTVMNASEAWTKAIESKKADLEVKNPLDLGLTVPSFEGAENIDPVDLADLCGVSRFAFGVDAINVQDLREEPVCERSWKRDGTVAKREDGGLLSERDWLAVKDHV